MERTVIVEGKKVVFILMGIKIFELECDNELEVKRVSKAWLKPPKPKKK